MAAPAGSRAVFLDRDGVINAALLRDGKPASPRCLAEFRLRPEITAALAALRAQGLRLFVVTNQPDLARGLLDPQTLQQINDRVRAALPIEDIRVCPHDDADDCACRKPRPGMLTGLAASNGIELARSIVVGDSWRDVQAARAAGCAGIILDRFYNREADADYRVPDLKAAARLILEKLL
jgi:D-glycero-D-manno-heptose 1,7-bisphosphate phosphatase